MSDRIYLYDTSLRDGSQGVGITYSLADKINVTHVLDEFGMDYIEGGWPGSNPKDVQFFKTIIKEKLQHSKVAAFGSTHRSGNQAESDANLIALVESGAPVLTIFGKCWPSHIAKALGISREENLSMIFESIKWLAERSDEIIFDAEHFFDGYAEEPAYAVRCLKTAWEAGARFLVLCDTNGGCSPDLISQITADVHKTVPTSLGIHAHNDGELAVANTLAAVKQGAVMVQGTINGMGERCGNANLCSVIPALTLKMKGYRFHEKVSPSGLFTLSRVVAEAANGKVGAHQPYVGDYAFAHKGGIHVSAVNRDPETYEHIDPLRVGNRRCVSVSELSGRSNILAQAGHLGFDSEAIRPHAGRLVERVKKLEAMGYHYEGAEASLELLIRSELGLRPDFFHIHGYRVWIWREGDNKARAEATIKAEVARTFWDQVDSDERIAHISADGDGPVEALDRALRMALERFFPSLKGVRLLDYKVRILDESAATRAVTRVVIQSGDGQQVWSTVGVSDNIIEASWIALLDATEYFLEKNKISGGES